MLPETIISQRKRDHIAINLERDVQFHGIATGFDQVRLMHTALPEIALHDVDTRSGFLGHPLAAPVLISSMTGGVDEGHRITRTLAEAAQNLGCALGVGSQRAAIEEPDRIATFQVRDIAPDILLFANLGAVQLNYGFGIDECRRAIEMIGADALILHLNPLQEALQPEGNRDFSGLLAKIAALCSSLEVPVVVKEIGCGTSPAVGRQLANAGVAAIDVSGSGGTSWSAVEHYRAESNLGRRISETFADWGIPTVTSLQMMREALPETPLIASGGLKTGLDVAKAVALGASLGGFAGTLLRAAATGPDETHAMLSTLIEELRLAMFCTGSRTLEDLRRPQALLWAPESPHAGREASS